MWLYHIMLSERWLLQVLSKLIGWKENTIYQILWRSRSLRVHSRLTVILSTIVLIFISVQRIIRWKPIDIYYNTAFYIVMLKHTLLIVMCEYDVISKLCVSLYIIMLWRYIYIIRQLIDILQLYTIYVLGDMNTYYINNGYWYEHCVVTT